LNTNLCDGGNDSKPTPWPCVGRVDVTRRIESGQWPSRSTPSAHRGATIAHQGPALDAAVVGMASGIKARGEGSGIGDTVDFGCEGEAPVEGFEGQGRFGPEGLRAMSDRRSSGAV
jgi:hypothetical protein